MTEQENAEAIGALEVILEDMRAGKAVAYALVCVNTSGLCHSGLRCPNGNEAHISWGMNLLQHILTTGCVQNHQTMQTGARLMS